MAPQQSRVEFNLLQYLGVMQQRECELQVNDVEEIKQRPVELWQSSTVGVFTAKISQQYSEIKGTEFNCMLITNYTTRAD